ncbi:MAG TPA: aminoglycoside phosphotransferase family protein [Polyangiaceae bacterium]
MVARLLPGARLVGVRPLAGDEEASVASHKGGGYGAPLALEVQGKDRVERLVLHTATKNQFGHDRRADRAADALLSFDNFRRIPLHVRALEVGAYTTNDELLPLTNATEFYVLTTFAEGEPYAQDLRAISDRAGLAPRDTERTDILARYLADLHRERHEDTVAWQRAARDLFGSGEGLFGILDAFPADTPGVSAERLERLERAALEYRPRLRAKHGRLATTHGDFHPFNLVFSQEGALAVLDASRGCLGDPADDVVCLAINYAFFALTARRDARPAFHELWSRFFRRYFEARPDPELLELAPPFLAWRALVLTNPVWYPDFPGAERDRLLTFVEQTLAAGTLVPEHANPLFT